MWDIDLNLCQNIQLHCYLVTATVLERVIHEGEFLKKGTKKRKIILLQERRA